ncbi:hypothetical protein F441_18847 [Phytophthora nicotianae CJ01A1]|uniref:Uncharacterized protein n=1 Tax=Phytophthora nicotianae CJ01A1 TaxID=1317063 RepID=W2W1E8_PHYNI|nr:hypothetical protein F441_18847 [Phytophthora nicotianae CJ01A1]
MASDESSTSEDIARSDTSTTPRRGTRSIRAVRPGHPYAGGSGARRSLEEALSPGDIQLVQDSPQYASPPVNTASHGPVRSPPTMQSPHLPQTTSGRERTPPTRRSPRLAAAVGVSNDTPPRATAARVVPSSLDEGVLTSLMQRRTHDGSSSSIEGHTNADANLYRLIVKPIVKQAVSQRDQTGEELEIYALWDKFRGHMKGRAVKADTGEWSIAELDIKEWVAMMQLKLPSRHLVDNVKRGTSGICG